MIENNSSIVIHEDSYKGSLLILGPWYQDYLLPDIKANLSQSLEQFW